MKKIGKIDIYVDGSCNSSTNTIGWGYKTSTGIEKHGIVTDPAAISMKNIAGELAATMRAVQYAISIEMESVCIHYDYDGIYKWVSGEWRTKKAGTISYRAFMDVATRKIRVIFQKVNSATNPADAVARKATGAACAH
jgi:ribonuclease HI